MSTAADVVMTAEGFLEHWQGHRRLTRRVIEAFPEDQLFTFSVGGMRPFGVLAQEMLAMALPMVSGAVTGEWNYEQSSDSMSKAELLARWDESTAGLEELWPRIAPERFQKTITAFGEYTDRLIGLLLYVVDNEVHHRGQGYVYLRALGIEPPPFYERS